MNCLGKSIYVVLFLCVLSLVVGCNKESIIDWKNTKEDAIEAGLQQEEAENESILSIEEFEGETFVFYEYKSGLGVANIVESEKGYSWNRSQPYQDFEVYGGKLPYSTAGFDIETETGLIVSVLIGKTFDSSIKEMKLSGDETDRKLRVFRDGFFYALHKLPFNKVDIAPIVN